MLLFVLSGLPLVSFAANTSEEQVSKKIFDILKNLDDKSSLEEISEMKKEVQAISDDLREKISRLEDEISQLDFVLPAVDNKGGDNNLSGEADSGIDKAREEKEADLSRLKLNLIVSRDAKNRLNEASREKLIHNLTYRNDELLSILKRNTLSGDNSPYRSFSWPSHDPAALELKNITPPIFVFFPALLLLLILIAGSIPVVRSAMLQFCKEDIFYYLDSILLQKSLFFRIVIVFFSLAVIGNWCFPGTDFLHVVLSWIALFFFFWATVPIGTRVVLYRLMACKSSDIGPERWTEWFYWRLFSFFTAVLFLCFSNLLFYFFPYGIRSVVRVVFLFCSLGFLAFFFSYLARKFSQSILCRLLRYTVWGCFFLSVGLEILGYQNLVNFLLKGVMETMILFALYLFCHDGIELFSGIIKNSSGHIFHKFISDEGELSQKKETEGSGNVAKFALKTMLYISFPYAVISVWSGVSDGATWFRQSFIEGFQLGNIVISPAMIMAAVVVVLAGWPGVSYLQQIVDRFWLGKADISGNIKEIILTVFRYFSYALLILVGLNIAGLSLSGLGIILGALSVGIGFGLQNVVNNFVSGLILVFEQPIKKGDWIAVGSTEGYVKKISIRSTVIETFDRADVIVPNSELISGQVKNMMLYNNRGRLRLSIGVAYGSDTRLVEKLLLSVTENKPEIIGREENFSLRPRVYFQEFGESSLNFDLLCYLRNVDNRVSVKSSLNFEIEQLFRKHEIEIPFPQRDIRIIGANAGIKQSDQQRAEL